MDPMTLATIVGLMGLFVSERRHLRAAASADEHSTVQQFQEWLRRHEHVAVLEHLEQNAALTRSLDAMLREQHDELLVRFRELDSILSSIATHLETFSAVAVAASPSGTLSEQAIEVLRQLEVAQATQFLEVKSGRSLVPHYLMFGGTSKEIVVSDPRFIEDDLQSLCALGLLREDFTSRGSRRFGVTRAGAMLARASDQTPEA